MAYDVEALLSRLANHYQIDRSTHVEYGSCRLYRARSTSRDDREVWIYVPRPEVYAISKARAALTRQLVAYRDQITSSAQPSLAEHFDFHTEKETGSAVALVLPRLESRVLSPDDPSIDYPARQGAMLRLVRALKALEDLGIIQPPVGDQAIAVVREAGVIQYQLAMVFFHAAGGPPPALLFQPAFVPPEFTRLGTQEILDTSVSRSGPAHVYALGAWCIYATAGPSALVRVFAQTMPESSAADPESVLGDVQFWTNIANSQTVPMRAAMAETERAGMSPELVDLMMRSVAHDPQNRPQSVTMFYEGLNSTVGRLPGAVEAVPERGRGRARARNSAAGGRSSTWLPYIFAAVVVSCVVGGGGFWIKRQQAAQALAEARAGMQSFCEPIYQRIQALNGTVFSQHPAWEPATAALNAALAIANDNTQLATTRRYCQTSLEGVELAVGETLAASRGALQAEIDFADETGLAPADIRTAAGDLAASAVPAEDLAGYDTALRNAAGALANAHDTAIAADADALSETLRGIRAAWSLPPDADPTATAQTALAEARALPPGPDRLRPLRAAAVALRDGSAEAVAADIGGIAGGFRSDLAALRAALGPTAEIADTERRLDALTAPVALEVVAVQQRYQALAGIASDITALQARATREGAALAALRSGIEQARARAEAQGYDEDPDLAATLLDSANLPGAAFALPEWQALAERVATQTAALGAEWQAGRAACADLRTLFAARAPELDGMPQLDQIRAADALAEGLEGDAPARRSTFAQCAAAAALVPQVATAAAGRNRLAALTGQRADVLEAGVGAGLDGFEALEEAYATLAARDLPRDQAALAAFGAEADRISGAYATMAAGLSDGLSGLRSRIDAVAARAAAQGFDEDPDLAAALAGATDLPLTAAGLARWQGLAATVESRATALEAEWQEGRTTCAALRGLYAANAARLADLPEFDGLTAADSAAAAIEGETTARRATFAQCAEAAAFIPPAATAAEGRARLAALAADRDAALAQGVGAPLAGFDAAEGAFAALASRDLPRDDAALAALTADSDALAARYAAMRAELSATLAGFAARIDAVAAGAGAQGYAEDAALSGALADAAGLPATSEALTAWSAAAEALETRAAELAVEWTAGRAVCASLRETFAARAGELTGMPELNGIRAADAAAAAIEGETPANRATFALCAAASAEIPRAASAAEGRARLSALATSREQALAAGVGEGIDGFAALEQDSAALNARPLPRDPEALAALTEDADRLAGAYAALTERLSSSISSLQARVGAVAARAASQGFDEDSALATVLASASALPATAAALADWQALTADAESRAGTLAAEWTAGRAVCAALREIYAARARDIEGMPEAGDLAAADAEAAGIAGDSPASRTTFARCAAAAALIPEIAIAAQGRTRLATLAATRDEAMAAGIGPALNGFEALERDYATLTAAPLPRDAEALAVLEAEADRLRAAYGTQAEDLSARLFALRERLARIADTAGAQGFDEDAELSAALATAGSLPGDAGSLADWDAQVARIEGLGAALTEEWRIGRETCTALGTLYAARAGDLESMPEAGDLAATAAAAAAIEGAAPASRATFALCAGGLELIPQVAIAAEARQRLDALRDARAAVIAAGVGPGFAPFDALESSFAALSDRPLPRDEAALARTTAEADRLAAGYAEARGGLAATLAEFRERLDTFGARASAQGYDEDAALAASLARANEIPATAAGLADWASLLATVEQQSTALGAEWAGGRDRCAALRALYAARASEIEGSPQADALRTADLAAAAIEGDAPARRDTFARCDEAALLIPQVARTAQATARLAALATVRAQAMAAGVDGRTPDFAAIERAYDSLVASPLPGSDDAFGRFADTAAALEEGYDTARAALAEAQARFRTLDTDEQSLAAQAATSGLAALPAWTDELATVPRPAGDNPFADVPQMETRIAAMQELARRFEAGAFRTCTLGDIPMAAVTVTAAEAQGLRLSRLAETAAPDYLAEAAARFAGNHCVSAGPVTIAELRRWQDQVEARDQALRREIDTAMVGPGPFAQPTSFFIARRYAEWLAQTTGEPVCVAPAELTLQALQSGAGGLTAGGAGRELTGSRCPDTSARQRLVVIDATDPAATPLCAAENERVAASFRVASGDICGGR